MARRNNWHSPGRCHAVSIIDEREGVDKSAGHADSAPELPGRLQSEQPVQTDFSEGDQDVFFGGI